MGFLDKLLGRKKDEAPAQTAPPPAPAETEPPSTPAPPDEAAPEHEHPHDHDH
jgi:hypothetical protein